MFFSVITKNLNWEILTENLVAFKRWNGLRMKNLNFMVVHWKIWLLVGGVHKKPLYRGNCLNRGLGQFVGSLAKKRGESVFEGGWCPDAHYDLILVHART